MAFPAELTKKWGAELGWKCQDCGKKWSDGWCLEGHHRVPTHMGGKDTRSNFRLLCCACHEKAHILLARMDARSANLIHYRVMKNNGRWRK